MAQHLALHLVHHGAGLSVDLVTMQRHLRVVHAHEVGIEQRRQQIARSRRCRHVEQPCLSPIAAERAALVPILNDQIAGIAQLLLQIFKGKRHAVSI